MPGSARTQPLSPPDRLVGWLVTGPLGHLAGFAIDAAIAWAGWARGAVGRRWSVGRRRWSVGRSRGSGGSGGQSSKR